MSKKLFVESTVKLGRVSTTDAIVAQIKESIQAGEFLPGSRLPSERMLQAQFGVSRLALRESLARLSALGIIRVAHGKGSFVATEASKSAMRDVLAPIFLRNDLKSLHDLAQARSLMEGELAAEAASRRSLKDLLILEESLNPQADLLDDPEAFAGLDYRFHQRVAHIAGNGFLTVMWEGLASHILGFLMEFAKESQDRISALERHIPLLEAIRAQDAEAARSLARAHLTPCLKHYEARLRRANHPALAIAKIPSKEPA